MTTPDRHPGELIEDDQILLQSNATPPTSPGALAFNGTSFQFRDSYGTFDPRTGGSGITEEQHKVLRQLIHFIEEGPAEGFASGAYKETTPSGPFPTLEVWYESSAKLKKIVQLATTWTGPNITQEEWKVYDTDGSTVLATVTDSITYSGVFESTRTRTITVP